MSPEMVVALGATTVAILGALGTFIAQLWTLRRTKSIEKATNGAVEASTAVRVDLEEKVKGLEDRLVTVIEEKLEAAAVAKQSASDVQEAMGERVARDPRERDS